jgi:hypothetical protein
MKPKILHGLSILFLLFAASCQNVNEEVFYGYFMKDPMYILTLNINKSGLVENLTDPYDGEPLFPEGQLSENFEVRVNCLIYDANGTLVIQKQSTSESFKELTTVSEFLNPGTYTILTGVDVVYNDSDYAWSYADWASLSTVKIMVSNYNDEYALFGYDKRTVTITDMDVVESVEPTHLGALYTIMFTNPGERYVYYQHEMNPDTYLFGSDSLSRSDEMIITQTLDFGVENFAYFIYAYFLPTENLALKYATRVTATGELSTAITVDLNVEAGVHRFLSIDVSNMSSTLSNLIPKGENISVLKPNLWR